MSQLLLLWVTFFVWTCALELPIYAAAVWRIRRAGASPFRLCLALNLLTHPALFLALRSLGQDWLLPGEALVVFVEGATLEALVPEVRRPFLVAALANAVSWIVGGALIGGV